MTLMFTKERPCENITTLINNQVEIMARDGVQFQDGYHITYMLYCPAGKMLTGTERRSDITTTTCMKNGEWEPDPTDIRCASKYYNLYMCTVCMSQIIFPY